MDVALADRIESRVTSRHVYGFGDCAQIPIRPELTGYAGLLRRNRNLERIHRCVQCPPWIVKRIAYSLQGIIQVVSVEFISIRDRAVSIRSKCPVWMLSQDIGDRLERCACCSRCIAGDRCRRDLAEQDQILQGKDHMLQLDLDCAVCIFVLDASDPPDHAVVIPHPAINCDAMQIRAGHGDHCRGITFTQAEAHGLDRDLAGRCQAMPTEQNH